MMKHREFIAVAALGLLSAFVPLDSAYPAKNSQPANDEAVDQAVERGVAYIKSKQRKDGSWEGGGHDCGVTALAVYALVKAECTFADPAVSGGISSMLNTPVPTDPQRATTYSLSLTALALSAAIEKAMDKQHPQSTNFNMTACQTRLRETADILVAAQHKCRGKVGIVGGPKTAKDVELGANPDGEGFNLGPFRGIDGGAWGYSLADTRYMDNSNTQFALLALRAAQNIGDSRTDAKIAIPREVWTKALARLVSVQAASGEWDYGTSAMGAKGFRDTMTAAGISGLVICLSSLVSEPDIRQITKTPELRRAVTKLERHVYPRANVVRFHSAGLSQPNRTGYMFYSLERACMLAGLKRLGSHDWYADGAAELLRMQRADGSWSGGAWYNARASRHNAPQFRDNTIETAFSLLFLRKAFVYTPAHKPYNP